MVHAYDAENEMDGDALATLLTVSSGPDCLKELIKKVGVRLKVYQLIKSLCSDETAVRQSCTCTPIYLRI